MNAHLLRAARLRFKHTRAARPASRLLQRHTWRSAEVQVRGACEVGWRWPSVRPRDWIRAGVEPVLPSFPCPVKPLYP